MIKFKSGEKGTYAQWGNIGKKFYPKNPTYDF